MFPAGPLGSLQSLGWLGTVFQNGETHDAHTNKQLRRRMRLLRKLHASVHTWPKWTPPPPQQQKPPLFPSKWPRPFLAFCTRLVSLPPRSLNYCHALTSTKYRPRRPCLSRMFPSNRLHLLRQALPRRCRVQVSHSTRLGSRPRQEPILQCTHQGFCPCNHVWLTSALENDVYLLPRPSGQDARLTCLWLPKHRSWRWSCVSGDQRWQHQSCFSAVEALRGWLS